MLRKWRIVFALASVAAVACAILFFMPKELSALISPDADEFSISSAIVEVSGKMSADAVTITDAAALSALAQVIRTAKVISVQSDEAEAGLFDKVTFFNEMLNKEMTIQIVTTLRQNALQGLISKESPVGKAILGHRVGDRVQVTVSDQLRYYVVIRSIEKGQDDDSMAISSY